MALTVAVGVGSGWEFVEFSSYRVRFAVEGRRLQSAVVGVRGEVAGVAPVGGLACLFDVLAESVEDVFELVGGRFGPVGVVAVVDRAMVETFDPFDGDVLGLLVAADPRVPPNRRKLIAVPLRHYKSHIESSLRYTLNTTTTYQPNSHPSHNQPIITVHSFSSSSASN